MLVCKNTAKERPAGGQSILPASKGALKIIPIIANYLNTVPIFRSEGEKVRVGDDLILVSVATERYLVRILTTIPIH